RTRSSTSGFVLKIATTTFWAGSATWPAEAWRARLFRRCAGRRLSARGAVGCPDAGVGKLLLGPQRQIHRQRAAAVCSAHLDVATVRARGAAHERKAADAPQPSVRALPASIHEHREPRRLAPFGAFKTYGRSAPGQIESDAHQGAQRGAHQPRIAAHLDLRLVGEDELHSTVARVRFALATRFRRDAVAADA